MSFNLPYILPVVSHKACIVISKTMLGYKIQTIICTNNLSNFGMIQGTLRNLTANQKSYKCTKSDVDSA